ncbi:MAG: ParA family protein [Bdellovibrionaceae bacterium]|nr:ParA family protein [Pseudobdellovibrionaceae bacterium]
MIEEASSLTAKSAVCLSAIDLADVVGLTLPQLKADFAKNFGTSHQLSYIPAELVREYLNQRGYKYPKKVVSFQMLKGGVAKTTSALNLGLRASMLGAKVLFVDLDQQANLTFALGHSDENAAVWLDIFEKKVSIEAAIKTINSHIDLIPSSLNNSVLERALINSNRNWSQSIKSQLAQVGLNYDLIIIDTAPALSATNTAVTVASDLVVLPVNPDKFSILGFEKNYQELQDIQKDFKIHADIKVLFTKYDAREKMSGEYLELFIQKYPNILLKSYIRVSSDAKNTLATSKSIYSTKSSAKEDYHLVTLELLEFQKENLCHL